MSCFYQSSVCWNGHACITAMLAISSTNKMAKGCHFQTLLFVEDESSPIVFQTLCLHCLVGSVSTDLERAGPALSTSRHATITWERACRIRPRMVVTCCRWDITEGHLAGLDEAPTTTTTRAYKVDMLRYKRQFSCE
jgi:hypothetical protein